jgi:hypothetical protein
MEREKVRGRVMEREWDRERKKEREKEWERERVGVSEMVIGRGT